MRLDLQVQTKDSRGAWRHLASTELGADSFHWRSGLKAGAKQLQQLEVKASDPHYDAKLFVCAHPYRTGSLHSEFGHAEAICRSANLEKFWLFWRCGKNVCVCACAKLSIVSPDWVPVATKSWFACVLCRSKSCSGAQTCGAFFNWIWQLKTHCSLRRRVAGSLAEPSPIQRIPFPNGLAQLCPRTFQTARHGGEDRLENWEPSATTLNVD